MEAISRIVEFFDKKFLLLVFRRLRAFHLMRAQRIEGTGRHIICNQDSEGAPETDAPSTEAEISADNLLSCSDYFLMALKASVCSWMPFSAARRSMEVAPKKPSMPGTFSMM